MRVDMRRQTRQTSRESYSIVWQDENGLTHSVQVTGLDISRNGLGVRAPVELPAGARVYLQTQNGAQGYAFVRHSTPHQSDYIIGFELGEGSCNPAPPADRRIDYYEFLQISSKAEFPTIQRVYRFLAGRFHPDNPDTGDSEKFLQLKRAFEVLSDPQQRAEYDRTRQSQPPPPPNPVFESIDYMDGIEGEVNRRLAILSLLYSKRRTCPDEPRVSLAEVESRMGFPREYLDFATWYLKNKKYITIEDNSDFALTALGVDYVEANSSKIPVLNKLLNSGPWGDKPGAGARRSPFADDIFRLGPGETGAEDTKGSGAIRDTPLQLT